MIDLLFDGRVHTVEDGAVVYHESHPKYSRLSNVAAAAVLNYMLVSWGNDTLLPQDSRLYTARRPGS